MNRLNEILQAVQDSMNEYAPSHVKTMSVEEARSAIVKMIRQDILPKRSEDKVSEKPLKGGMEIGVTPAKLDWNSCLDTIESKLKELADD